MTYSMKLLKYLIIPLVCFCVAAPVLAQYDYPGEAGKEEKVKKKLKPEISSRIFFSPRLGFSAWENTAYFEIAPIVGYKFTTRFWLGTGPEYMYLKSGTYKTHIYGLTSFGYFAFLDNIDEVVNLGIRSVFLYLENEILSIQPPGTSREWYDLVLGGVGIRMPIGESMGISIIAVWGLNRATELLYSNPEIRIMYDF